MDGRLGLLTLLLLVPAGCQLPEVNEHLIESRPASTEANTDSLQYVQILWRHGDRTPAAVFDPEEEKTWPEGLGELTKEGMAQHYRLGKWLRSRYGRWLGERFDRSEVYVRSSDFNRTLMSALANMAGLFPPQKQEVWDQMMPWQPVPVHTVPKNMDKQLYEDIPCPKADSDSKAIYNSAEVKKIELDNADFLQYLAQNTGSNTPGLSALWKVYDSLNCQFHHNTTHHWPSWVNQTIFDKILELYDISSRFKFHSEFLRRIRGGPLLDDIYHRFLDKRDGRMGSKPKLYAYSAHDTTLAALLATLGIYPKVFPLYATAVILEMHKMNGESVIELYRKNITDSSMLFHTQIPGCDEPCTLEKLHNEMGKYIPKDWESECGFNGHSHFGYIVAICVLASTTALFGGILTLDVFLKYRRRPSSSSRGAEPLINEEEDVS